MAARFPSAIILAGLLSVTALAQTSVKKSVLDGDWKKVELLGAVTVSRDGRWVLAQTTPVEGDSVLTVKNNDEPVAFSTLGGRNGQFTRDSKFVTYLVTPPKEVADRLRAERKPINPRFAARILPAGTELLIDNVDQYELVQGGKYAILRRARAAGATEPRSDLTILEIATGETMTIGNVSRAVANEDESVLALQIRADHGERGIQLLELGQQRVKTIFWGKDEISALTWSEEGATLAWLAGPEEPAGKVGSPYRIHVAVTDGTALQERFVYEPTKDPQFPKTHRINEAAGLLLSRKGERIGFGVSEWKDKPKPSKPDETAAVEVWNTKDLTIVPAQKARARFLQSQSDTYLWSRSAPTAKALTTGIYQSGFFLNDFLHFVRVDRKPYVSAVTDGKIKLDASLLDLSQQNEQLILTAVNFVPIPSATDRYITHFAGGQWSILDSQNPKWVPVTSRLKRTFADTEVDIPVAELPPADRPVWSNDDSIAVFSDGYDLFRYRPVADSLETLSNGKPDSVSFSPIDVERDPKLRGFETSQPLYVSVFNRKTKASGFGVVKDNQVQVLSIDNRALSNLQHAADTDRMVFTMGSFTESPAVYVTNTQFTAAKPVFRTNGWLKDYAWGKSELVTYKSQWGKELQGVLIYPANYDPQRRYPMVTYIYERLSDSLHQFVRPIEASAYNEQWLSQQGYFVFKPDIAYRDGTPGQDAVACLTPALAAVFAKRIGVDPDRVALMGHSWGGYQTAFATTVTKSFAVGIAGAPLTELTSMYSTVYWNSGTPNSEIFESSQGRMRLPFWEISDKYFANSPVWQANKRTAPLLMTFGDSDGAVDFRQGVQFYNTLRRLGKEAVMLVYNGENHNLAKPANRLDYARRVRHFLDVYLRNARPEPWIETGIPYSPPSGAPAPSGAPLSVGGGF